MRMPDAGWTDFQCKMEEWCARRSMSWGSVIDYRKKKGPIEVEYALPLRERE